MNLTMSDDTGPTGVVRIQPTFPSPCLVGQSWDNEIARSAFTFLSHFVQRRVVIGAGVAGSSVSRATRQRSPRLLRLPGHRGQR
jgi:hypothetical protein